jgi:HK97 family phage prohead protease
MAEERRRLPVETAGVCLRAVDGDGAEDGAAAAERFNGHAAVFNVRAAIGNPLRWGFYEEFIPGAFTDTIVEDDVRKLIDHDSYYVVSRMSAGSLLLAQDGVGLAVDSALDEGLSYVRDLKANVRNRNITGMSMGFLVLEDTWSTEEVEVPGFDTSFTVDVRKVSKAKLIEVSSVTFPAYVDTDADLRSVATALVHRGDVAAIERRAAQRPELLELLKVLDREADGATRTDGTRRDFEEIDRVMRALQLRYRLSR